MEIAVDVGPNCGGKKKNYVWKGHPGRHTVCRRLRAVAARLEIEENEHEMCGTVDPPEPSSQWFLCCAQMARPFGRASLGRSARFETESRGKHMARLRLQFGLRELLTLLCLAASVSSIAMFVIKGIPPTQLAYTPQARDAALANGRPAT